MPYVLKNQPAMPDGYCIIRFHELHEASYYLVFCLATGRYVGKARHYTNQRAAVLAAKRSAFMVAYNRCVNAA